MSEEKQLTSYQIETIISDKSLGLDAGRKETLKWLLLNAAPNPNAKSVLPARVWVKHFIKLVQGPKENLAEYLLRGDAALFQERIERCNHVSVNGEAPRDLLNTPISASWVGSFEAHNISEIRGKAKGVGNTKLCEFLDRWEKEIEQERKKEFAFNFEPVKKRLDQRGLPIARVEGTGRFHDVHEADKEDWKRSSEPAQYENLPSTKPQELKKEEKREVFAQGSSPYALQEFQGGSSLREEKELALAVELSLAGDDVPEKDSKKDQDEQNEIKKNAKNLGITLQKRNMHLVRDKEDFLISLDPKNTEQKIEMLESEITALKEFQKSQNKRDEEPPKDQGDFASKEAYLEDLLKRYHKVIDSLIMQDDSQQKYTPGFLKKNGDPFGEFGMVVRGPNNTRGMAYSRGEALQIMGGVQSLSLSGDGPAAQQGEREQPSSGKSA